MCFETTKTARAKIAKKDIECWKILESDGQPFHWDHLPPYKVNVINLRVKIKVDIVELYEGQYLYEINEGYHSYKSEAIAISCGTNRIKKFIIPKGTRYFSNRTDYVSETIMLVS